MKDLKSSAPIIKPSFFHPNALVESNEIGAGSRVWAFAHMVKGAVMGADCNIEDHSFFEVPNCGRLMGNDNILSNDKKAASAALRVWER